MTLNIVSQQYAYSAQEVYFTLSNTSHITKSRPVCEVAVCKNVLEGTVRSFWFN